jgi:hypothetical protein
MKYSIISLVTAALFILSWAPPARADETTEEPPNVSFGIAGSFSGHGYWERKRDDQHAWARLAPGYGGGFVFEKMFNNLIGIHTGLWFNRINSDIRMKQRLTDLTNISIMNALPFKLVGKGWSLSFPLSLLLSLNASVFSFNILGGIKYTHILESSLKPDNRMFTYKRTFDLLPHMNQPQFGFSLGLHFKFRITRFTDLFFGCNGDLYVTDFMKDRSGILLPYTLSVLSGVLFRTNIFPISD